MARLGLVSPSSARGLLPRAARGSVCSACPVQHQLVLVTMHCKLRLLILHCFVRLINRQSPQTLVTRGSPMADVVIASHANESVNRLVDWHWGRAREGQTVAATKLGNIAPRCTHRKILGTLSVPTPPASLCGGIKTLLGVGIREKSTVAERKHNLV